LTAGATTRKSPGARLSSRALGRLRYLAVASPQFVRRHFRDGVTAAALAAAPTLTFNRKDRLQGQWMQRLCRRAVEAPTHWLPSTQAFVDATLAGVGWAMNPQALVERHLRSNALVELVPDRSLRVPLYWQSTRLAVPLLARLTEAVTRSARGALE